MCRRCVQGWQCRVQSDPVRLQCVNGVRCPVCSRGVGTFKWAFRHPSISVCKDSSQLAHARNTQFGIRRMRIGYKSRYKCPPCPALPLLAVSVRLAKRRCLAFAPPPSSPGCDGPKREEKSEPDETSLAHRAVSTPRSEPLSLFSLHTPQCTD